MKERIAFWIGSSLLLGAALAAALQLPPPSAIAQQKMDRHVTVDQYRNMYGREPTGEWVLRDGENIDWWKPHVSKHYHLAMVVPHVRDPYWIAVVYGAYLEAKELGVELDLRPAGGYMKLDQMISDIEDLIARHVDGMVISAVDYSAVAVPVKHAWDSGIFTSSALIPTAYKEAPGATINDYETGVIQAKLAAERLPKDAKIFMLNGPPGVEWGKVRAQGFKET